MKETLYLVNIPEYHGNDWDARYANSFKDAAISTSREHNDNGDFNDEDVVGVRNVVTGVKKLFGVKSEIDVVYNAREIDCK